MNILPVFIPHMGCPNLCVFCNQRSITGAAAIVPSQEEICRMAEEAVERTGRKGFELAFYGGSFTSIPKQIQKDCLDAASGLFRRGLISSIRISARPDAMDDETLDFLSGYPVKTVELGVQSMEDKVLELAARGCASQDAIDAAERVKARGISLILQMMAGLPGESQSSPMETARRIAELCPDGVRIYPVVVIKGTELEKMWLRGEYEPLDVDRAADICADLLEFFGEKGIPVIRCGLNPSEELKGEVAAGAYHPAFGEIARSRLMFKKVCAAAEKLKPRPAELRIFVHPSFVSPMIGQRRENILRLKDRFGFSKVEVKSADIEPGKVEITAI